jgi:hypothetical protein
MPPTVPFNAEFAVLEGEMSRQIGLGGIALLVAVTGCESSHPPPTAPNPPPTMMGSPIPTPPEPSAPTDSIVGRYKLDLTVGSECGAVPDAARSRTYTATIDSTGGTNYVVTLSDASFLSGPICTAAPSRLGCHQFQASRAGDLLRFDLINENDDGHGGHIVEQIPPGTWIELTGSGTGRMQGQDGTITASGSASVWYCPTVSGYPFPCRSHVGCRPGD